MEGVGSLPQNGVENRHTRPGSKGAKSYVCKMVKTESFHLWKMNTSDLANVSPRGKGAHTHPQTGFSWQKPNLLLWGGSTSPPESLRRMSACLSLQRKEKTLPSRGLRVGGGSAKEGLSGFISLTFSKDRQLLVAVQTLAGIITSRHCLSESNVAPSAHDFWCLLWKGG